MLCTDSEDGNNTPSLPILQSFAFALGHPFPADFSAIFTLSVQIPLIDTLNTEAILQRRLKEPSDNRPSSMKPRNNPDLPPRSQEPAHRANEVLVLTAHPETVCCDDARVGGFVGDSPGIRCEGTPFVWLDCDLAWV